MRVAIFGATGALGSECLSQCLAAGHDVNVLARDPSKLAANVRERITVTTGNGLDAEAVARTLVGAQAVLFAIGVDKNSPADLCTDVTRHIFDAMPAAGTERFIWCGGGSTLVEADHRGFGERFVRFFASRFMSLRHVDKEHQYAWLCLHKQIRWFGIRPLQMNSGQMRGQYRVGFDRFSGLSKIYFPDCAHAMIGMLEDDTWLHQAPIIQY